jgi:8-oxo-dGTP pyrophosphatase MutT (NUDIX family)
MQDKHLVLAEARAAVERYATRFPDEADAVAALRAQLRGDDGILERSNMRGHVTTSALVLDPTLTEALVIHHRVFDVWLQPGGHYEPPGSLWESACREVREETGLDCMQPFASTTDDALFDIDTHPIPARAAKAEGAHRHHDFAYLAIAPRAFVPAPQVEEVHDVRWASLASLTHASNARLRRLAAKATAVVAAFSAGRSAA